MSNDIVLNVNGRPYPLDVDPHASLLHVVRDQVGLTGSKEGCDDSECGACMMLLDGQPVNSCSYLAVQADGAEVTTVEGLTPGNGLSPLQEALLTEGGVQCGFCTPGMVVARRGEVGTLRQPVPLHRLRRHRSCRAHRRGYRRSGLS